MALAKHNKFLCPHGYKKNTCGTIIVNYCPTDVINSTSAAILKNGPAPRIDY